MSGVLLCLGVWLCLGVYCCCCWWCCQDGGVPDKEEQAENVPPDQRNVAPTGIEQLVQSQIEAVRRQWKVKERQWQGQ